jgi:EAL domain-containing protein (putative c-di-GMP-specific phosphodiesterase class I)
VAVFDNRMRERMSERLAIESALRGALERRELELHYQPIVNLDSGEVTAVEALLRWRHPLRGLLWPADFLPVAEATGLIAEIGDWTLEEACREAAQWRDARRGAEPIPVSVNVSGYQLTRGGVAGGVARALAASGLEPALLELELTEAALLEDLIAGGRELARLKQLGVRLVIDDFGTGYSSLSALRRLSVDGLKLDRSFVDALGSDEDSDSMVAAVVSMAAALGAKVTAEGVETRDQAECLCRHGCDHAQGLLFGRPVSAEELTAMLLSGAGAGAGAGAAV